MSDFEIAREENGPSGRYVISRDGVEAELTYTIAAPDRVIADHVGAPQALRGTGAALALVKRLVEDARAEGFRIVPRCPYVDVQRRKHPEWAEVFES